MEIDRVAAVPDLRICEQARISRDPRFDGLFFTAVTSTRIYCRTVCPVPTVRSEHVIYYPSAAAAEAAGYRPCLRCKPELAPGAWPRGDALIERALKLIDEGLLVNYPLATLADRVGLGERQLRRLFLERLGASPLRVHLTRRLLFARQLLTETTLPITDVALEADFGSLRRFNASFRKTYRLAPSELRRKPPRSGNEILTLRLGYRPPYEFSLALRFLRARSLAGVEVVDKDGYARVFGPPNAPGWLRISAAPGSGNFLQLQLHCQQSVRILEVVSRLRRMFDLDADSETITAQLSQSARLRDCVTRHPGLRLIGGWDGFEVASRVVLERQVDSVTTRMLAARLVHRYGDALATPYGSELERLFPTPDTLAHADLTAIGWPQSCASTVSILARALLDGKVDFRSERTIEEFVACWSALPGIDTSTAHVIALRALGHPDAFPAGDLIPLHHTGNGNAVTLDMRALYAHAERWRPWRAYAVRHLQLGAAEEEHSFNRLPGMPETESYDARRAP